jgi:hypothetical protein
MAQTANPVNAVSKAQTHICKMTFMKIEGTTTRPGHRRPAGRVSRRIGSRPPKQASYARQVSIRPIECRPPDFANRLK